MIVTTESAGIKRWASDNTVVMNVITEMFEQLAENKTKVSMRDLWCYARLFFASAVNANGRKYHFPNGLSVQLGWYLAELYPQYAHKITGQVGRYYAANV